MLWRWKKPGADILDIGAESTRPGSAEISVVEELRRLLPVLQALRGKIKIPISVDTRKSSVAEITLGAGAEIINDVSALRLRSAHRRSCRRQKMRAHPDAHARRAGDDANASICEERRCRRDKRICARLWRSRSRLALRKSQIVLDPGIGFGKSFPQNYELLRRLPEIARLGYPLAVGTSRKGFLGHTLALAKEGAFDERARHSASSVEETRDAAQQQTRALGRAPFRDRRDSRRQHPRRRPHRPRPRRRRDGASRRRHRSHPRFVARHIRHRHSCLCAPARPHYRSTTFA